MRCILIYSGIHYDAASLAPVADAPTEWHQTLFPVVSLFLISLKQSKKDRRLTLVYFKLNKNSSNDSDPILVAAKKLATILRGKKAFTNTSTFDLKCEVSLERSLSHSLLLGLTLFFFRFVGKA